MASNNNTITRYPFLFQKCLFTILTATYQRKDILFVFYESWPISLCLIISSCIYLVWKHDPIIFSGWEMLNGISANSIFSMELWLERMLSRFYTLAIIHRTTIIMGYKKHITCLFHFGGRVVIPLSGMSESYD